MASSRERIIFIVAGVTIGAFALDSALVSPLFARLSDAEQRGRLAQAEIDRGEGLGQNRNRAARVWKDLTAGTLKADRSAAESQLLNGVRVWAQQAGVNLVSLKPEGRDAEEGFGRIDVRAQASGTMASLSKFLYLAEASQIPVRLADMTLNSRKDGEDDLALQVGLSTIYELPPTPAKTGGSR